MRLPCATSITISPLSTPHAFGHRRWMWVSKQARVPTRPPACFRCKLYRSIVSIQEESCFKSKFPCHLIAIALNAVLDLLDRARCGLIRTAIGGSFSSFCLSEGVFLDTLSRVQSICTNNTNIRSKDAHDITTMKRLAITASLGKRSYFPPVLYHISDEWLLQNDAAVRTIDSYFNRRQLHYVSSLLNIR